MTGHAPREGLADAEGDEDVHRGHQSVLLLPALPILVQALDFTSSYLANRTSHVFSFADIAFNLARETARDPLTIAFAAFGFLVWIKKARYIVLRDWDPYETIQQSCTPYGLLSNYVLEAARREKDSPNKSFAARYGERFANPWHPPFEVRGFHEAGTIGQIKVYLRNGIKPSPK